MIPAFMLPSVASEERRKMRPDIMFVDGLFVCLFTTLSEA
jgi:hypothetical protein